MPNGELQEKDRAKLDAIVQKMVQNNEPEDNIKFVVEDFKKKYSSLKKKGTTELQSEQKTESTSSVTPPQKGQKPSVSSGTKQVEIFTGLPTKEENQYRVVNNKWQRLVPNSTKWQDVGDEGAVSYLNKYYGKNVKVPTAVQIEEKGPQFTDINSKLISKTEEKVVPYLQRQYGKLGFTFEQSGLGTDYVKVISKNGNTIEVGLDEANPDEALKLKSFLEGNKSAQTVVGQKLKGLSNYLFNPNLTPDQEEQAAKQWRQYRKSDEYVNDLKSLSYDELEEQIKNNKEEFNQRLFGATPEEKIKIKKEISEYYNSNAYKVYKDRLDQKSKEHSEKVGQLYYDLKNAKTSEEKKEIKAKIDTYLSDKLINKQADNYNIQLSDVAKSYKKLDAAIYQFNKDKEDLNQRVKSGSISQEEYESLANSINTRAEYLDSRRQEIKSERDKVVSDMNKLQTVAGKYLIDKEKTGSFLGNMLNSFVTGVDQIFEQSPLISGMRKAESLVNDKYETLDPEEKKRLENKGYNKQEIEQYIINKNSLARIEEGRKKAIEAFGTSGTTKEYAESKDRGFFEQAFAGVAQSLPGMIMPGGAISRMSALSAQAYSSIEEEMLKDSDFETTTAKERASVAMPYAIGMGILENFGITTAMSKNPLVKSLITKSIVGAVKKIGGDASKEVIENVINKEIKSNIAKFGIRVVGGTLAEAETGALQSAALDIGLKGLYNTIKEANDGKTAEELTQGEYFDTPDSFMAGVSQVAKDAAAEAVGGFALTSLSTGAERIFRGGISLYNEKDVEFLKGLSEDSEVKKMFVAKLKTNMLTGKMTKSEAEAQLNAVNELESTFKGIPDNITGKDLKESVGLITERNKLQKEIQGKDESLTAAQRARISEINTQLSKISEDATKKSNIAEQEVGTEGGIVQREGTDGGQQEVGQGEGGQRETTQPGTNLGDRLQPSEEEKVGANVRSVINRPTTLSGFGGVTFETPLIGDTYVDGQQVVFEERGTGKVYELGNVDDVMDTEMPTLQAQEERIGITPEGKVSIDGNNWNIQSELPTQGIEYNPAGEVMRVSLKDDNGNTTMFDGQDAVDIAYQIELQKIQSPEQQQLINDLLEQDEEFQAATADIKPGQVEATVQEEATPDTVQASKQKTVSTHNEQGGSSISQIGEDLFGKPGFSVSVHPDRTMIVDGKDITEQDLDAFREDNKDLLSDPENFIGTWFDQSSGKTYIDISTRKENKQDAIDLAIRYNQKAIFDLENGVEIDTGGTGENIQTEVESLGQFLGSTDQEIDQNVERISNKKLAKNISRAAKALSKILPNVKFVVHDNEESFRNITGEERNQESSGAYVNGTVHINLSKANARTVAHEVFHAILLDKVKTDANAQAVTKRMVQAIANKIEGNKDLKAYLDDFIANYEENIQNEEKLAELVGKLAENYNSFGASIKDLIKRWLDKITDIFGLDPFNRNEVYDMLNTIARKVAKGEVITEADVSVFKGGETIENPSEGLTTRFQYGNDKVKLEVTYLEQDRMDQLIKDGLVTQPDSLSELNGMRAVTTSPDDMLVGSISVNGEKVADGNGGVFFVTKFGDVWANSDKKTANMLKNAINESSEKNNGKSYLALSKGTDAKLVSSPQGVTSSLAVTEAMLDAGLFSLSDFRMAVRDAVKLAGGDIKLSPNGSAKQLKSEVDNFFKDVNSSTFEKRGNVLKGIISNLAKSQSVKDNKNEIISFLDGDKSKVLTVGNTDKSQSLVDLVAKVSAEKLTKGLKTGDIYAVIEIDGKVDVFQDEHQSYPYHIKIVDEKGNASNKKPILILPKNRKNGRQILTSLDGETVQQLGEKAFAGKVGATANMPLGKGIIQDTEQPSIRKQIALPAEVSDKLTEDKNGNIVFHHYSQQNRETIKPRSGDNIITGKDEASALSSVGGIAQYYTMADQAEPGVGPVLHTVVVPKDKVYYLQTDSENFYDQAKKEFEKIRPGQAFNPNYQAAWIAKVANDNGYDMLISKWRNNEFRAQTTKELTPIEGNIEFKPREAEGYKVGDDVMVYGMKVKVTAIDGPNIEFKGDGGSGSINFERSPRSITKIIPTAEEVKSEVDSMDQTIRKQKDNTVAKIVKKAKDAGYSDAAIVQYLRNNGYTFRQANNAIINYNLNTEDVFLANRDTRKDSIKSSLKSFRKKALSARGFLPRSVFRYKELMNASIANQLFLVDKNTDKFSSMYSKYDGDKEELLKNFDAYLRGNQNVDLPEDFKILARSMRNQIDGLSKMLIDSGVVDEDMAQTIMDNMGSYLTRSYAVFDRKNWKDEVQDDIVQTAKNFLRSQYRSWAEEIAQKTGETVEFELERLVDEEINKIIDRPENSRFFSSSKLGSKDLSILKERQDIPFEIRALMGEYSDPALTYAETVLKLANLAAKHNFLSQIKKEGLGTYFFEENDVNRPKEFDTKIAADKSEVMAPLNGLMTTKEIAKAFENEFNNKDLQGWIKTLIKIQSAVKYSKTIASVGTHFKNFFGNIGFMWMNGHISPKEVANSFSVIRNELFKGNKEELKNKMAEYIKAGVVNQSAGLNEIRDMFKDANFDIALAKRVSMHDAGKLGIAKRRALKFKKGVEDWYQAEDDFFKIIGYEMELSRYAEALYGKDKSKLTPDELEEVKKVAVENVKNTYPSYDRIPAAIKLISKSYVLGNFISFQAEAYRTLYNTFALATEELKSDNPEIKKIGAKRLVGASTYLTAKSAIISAVGMAAGTGLTGIMGALGDDDDEKEKDKDIRKFIPEWSKDSDLIVLSAGDGKIKYIDFSSADPHGGLRKAMNAFLNGETTEKKFIDGALAAVQPFLGTEMSVEAVNNLYNNIDKYGNQIWNPEDNAFNKTRAITSYIYSLAEPGTVSSIRRGAKAENKVAELAANLTGYRIYDVEVDKQFSFKMAEISDRIKDAKRIYNSKYYSEKATQEDVDKAYDNSQKSLDKIYKEILGAYDSAERLGVDYESLVNSLKEDAGMSKKDINTLLSGELPVLEYKQE
jgi:hypothetical protein